MPMMRGRSRLSPAMAARGRSSSASRRVSRGSGSARNSAAEKWRRLVPLRSRLITSAEANVGSVRPATERRCARPAAPGVPSANWAMARMARVSCTRGAYASGRRLASAERGLRLRRADAGRTPLGLDRAHLLQRAASETRKADHVDLLLDHALHQQRLAVGGPSDALAPAADGQLGGLGQLGAGTRPDLQNRVAVEEG